MEWRILCKIVPRVPLIDGVSFKLSTPMKNNCSQLTDSVYNWSQKSLALTHFRGHSEYWKLLMTSFNNTVPPIPSSKQHHAHADWNYSAVNSTVSVVACTSAAASPRMKRLTNSRSCSWCVISVLAALWTEATPDIIRCSGRCRMYFRVVFHFLC